MSTLGSRLRAAREKKGWSQTFVCQKLGISNSTLSGYERNYREPDADMITTFASLYEVDPGELLTGKLDTRSTNGKISSGGMAFLGGAVTEEELAIAEAAAQAAIEAYRKGKQRGQTEK